jgi:hypothetical protein
MAAITKKTTAIAAKVAGSVALTPTSMVVIPRVRANAAISPAATPMAKLAKQVNEKLRRVSVAPRASA